MEKILRETFTRFNSESKQNIDVDSLVTSAMNMMPEFDETFINENISEILETLKSIYSCGNSSISNEINLEELDKVTIIPKENIEYPEKTNILKYFEIMDNTNKIKLFERVCLYDRIIYKLKMLLTEEIFTIDKNMLFIVDKL